MSDISGPVSTLTGARFSVPEGAECDDCVVALCNETAKKRTSSLLNYHYASGKRPEGYGKPWWDIKALKEEHDRLKALLPPASVRIQGETDSFGAEFFDLCEKHASYWEA